MRIVWIICGFIALGVGVIGMVLPLVPTVPLILLAAFCFAQSSTRLHQWLIHHRVFGPMISDWQTRRAIRPRAKYLATLSISIVFGLSIVFGAPSFVIALQAVVLGCVLLFIWTRPN
jgi:uncharacterized membrane protein YbaN (DUF454 family)